MRLASYMRGLGIGMAVTALILHFSGPKEAGMSDDEVRSRARQLGMTESRMLTDNASSVSGGNSGTALSLPNVGDANDVREAGAAAAADLNGLVNFEQGSDATVSDDAAGTGEKKENDSSVVTPAPTQDEEPEATKVPTAT